MEESKEQKALNMILEGLSYHDDFDTKHNYLQNHPYLERAYEKFPNLKKEVNKTMISHIIQEFGDETSDAFTFSKDVSDKEILRHLETQEINEEYLRDFALDITPELANQLSTLSFESGIDEEGNPISIPFSDYISKTKGGYDKDEIYKLHGTEAFAGIMDLKNELFKEIDDLKSGYRKNIKTLRREFDDRSSVLGGTLRATPFPWMPELAKGVMQLSAGWMDWFAHEGLERVENRQLNWDPENKRYGPGPEIKREQAKLKNVLSEESELKDVFEGIDTKHEELTELLDEMTKREEVLGPPGIDEALSYLSDEAELRSLLGE